MNKRISKWSAEGLVTLGVQWNFLFRDFNSGFHFDLSGAVEREGLAVGLVDS